MTPMEQAIADYRQAAQEVRETDEKSAAAERLKAARAALKTITDELNSISEAMRQADQSIAPVQQAASAVQNLKQQRRGLFARMLRAGRVDLKDKQASDLSLQISTAEVSVEQTAAVMEAHRDLMAELQQKADEVHAQMPDARRALAEAQFEAATAEIRLDALPAFLAACDTFGRAYGRLAGLGVAHCELARELRDTHGVMTGGLGTELPMRTFDVVAIGFGLSESHAMNVKTIDARGAIEQARAEALTSWRVA